MGNTNCDTFMAFMAVCLPLEMFPILVGLIYIGFALLFEWVCVCSLFMSCNQSQDISLVFLHCYIKYAGLDNRFCTGLV